MTKRNQEVLLSRRRFLLYTGLASAGLAAACAPGATPAAGVSTPTTGPAKPGATPAGASTPAKAAAPATVRSATIEGLLENANWMTGREQGFFEEFGVDFDAAMFRDGNTATNSILSGDADFGDTGIGQVLAAIEKGAELRMIGTSRPGLNYVVYSRPEIESLKDLEGQAVGTAAPGSFLQLLMLALFRAEGVDVDRVNFVNVGASPDVFRAVVAGTVAAGPASVDLSPVAESEGVKSLVNTWEVLPNYVRIGLYASTQAIEERGEEIARALAGYAQSNRYVVTPESRERWIEIAMEELGATRDQAEFSWEFQASNPILAPNLDFTEEQAEYMQEQNVLAGSQERVLPFDEVADMSLQQRALELAGRA